jgi:uncharacterized membrane protein
MPSVCGSLVSSRLVCPKKTLSESTREHFSKWGKTYALGIVLVASLVLAYGIYYATPEPFPVRYRSSSQIEMVDSSPLSSTGSYVMRKLKNYITASSKRTVPISNQIFDRRQIIAE